MQRRGRATPPRINSDDPEMLGKTYKSNFWGDLEVIAYETSKNITVRFKETGHETKTQRETILTGQVRDEVQWQQRSDDLHTLRVLLDEDLARVRDAVAAEAELKRKLRQWAREDSAEGRERKSRMDGAVARFRLHGGKEYTNGLGDCYKVLRSTGQRWKVFFYRTGNIVTGKGMQLARGNVHDIAAPDHAERLAARNRDLSALWYESNRDNVIAKASAYQKANLEAARARNRNRRAKRDGAGGTHTVEEVDVMFEQQDRKCACCGEPLTKDSRHLDHVMPISLGGRNDIGNLQWLCQFCNNSKSNKHPDDWAKYCSTEAFKQRREARRRAFSHCEI